jgi:hypothetical protein
MFGRFGRELVRFLTMLVGRRDVFLRLVVIALIVLVGGFVVTMFGGDVAAGSLNVSLRSRMLGSGACHDDCLSSSVIAYDVSGTMTFW